MTKIALLCLIKYMKALCTYNYNGTKTNVFIAFCMILNIHVFLSFWFLTEITPPRAEACPQDIKESTGSYETEVHKPEIRFVTSEGHPAPYSCSHFNNRDSFNFTIGVHTVTCTASDPYYGYDATASCTFQVIIKCKFYPL